MKKRSKQIFGFLGILATLGILTSCNSFCSVEDSAAYRYAYDPVNTIFFESEDDAADYLLNSQVDWFDTPTKQVPAVKYTIELKSTDGVKIGEWTEVVHQADGDRSWW